MLSKIETVIIVEGIDFNYELSKIYLSSCMHRLTIQFQDLSSGLE